MANITDKVTAIRAATYGSQVRESIAAGIEGINAESETVVENQNNLQTTFNQLIINAGSSNAEIVVARGTAAALSDRLDSADAKLNVAAKKTDWDARHNATGFWDKYSLPAALSDFLINVFTDGQSFKTDYDITTKKHMGGITYYVQPDTGLDTNSGLTTGLALKSVKAAYDKCVDNDTIVMMDGQYTRATWFGTTAGNILVDKSINIVAQNNGKALVKSGDNHTFASTAYPGVYSTSRTVVRSVIDIRFLSSMITSKLNQVMSLSECAATENTWFQDTSLVYVHMVGGIQPTNSNCIVSIGTGAPLLNVTCQTKNVNLYIEGIQFFGGNVGGNIFRNSATYTSPELYAKDCLFAYGYSDGVAFKDGISVLGAKAAFVNCITCYASKDGFNYHADNGVACKAVEINCKAYGNGKGWVDNTCNGSTAHDGSKVLRINSTYYNNQGGNVTDVNADTVTVCLGCTAFDSISTTQDGYNGDFILQQTGATMYLDNCVAFGSTNNIRAVAGTTINAHNCLYDTATGDGTININ